MRIKATAHYIKSGKMKRKDKFEFAKEIIQ